MAWIESHQKLEKSGKLYVLAHHLGINRYQAIGHLHAFWWWCIDNAEDGDVTRFGSVTLAQVVGWDEFCREDRMASKPIGAKPEDFVEGMLKAGFLDQIGEKIIVHNWESYSHRYFAMIEKSNRNREMTRERVRSFRERNANVTQPSNAAVTPSNAPTVHNRTVHNRTKETPAAGAVFSFDLIWNQYPNRIGKKQAERHFKASVKTEKDFNDLNTALQNFKKKIATERIEPQFIPHGSTWFNNWRDYVTYTGVEPVRIPSPAPVRTYVETAPPPEQTEEDLAEMHRTRVRNTGRCTTKNCTVCVKEAV